MKLSREWLGEYTRIDASDKDYCDAMTMSGSKVEGWEVTGSEISNVVVGRVDSIERHTNSDHMWVCRVDVGGRCVQIVTGAQNVRAGDLVPVALDGSTLPGGVEIHTGKLRGELSEGMLCSLKELGLEQRDFPYAIEDGIFILEEDCAPGDDIRGVCGFGDSVVEFEITNNRPDCLSVRGLARESAATFHTPLTLPEPAVKGGAGDIRDMLSVEIQNGELCPRYTAKMVKNIRIAPSPKWMRRRLRASGVRPINNIVDITNYVMLEYGQPMHAFDYSCLHEGRIVVRNAREGEVMQTLDGNDRPLTPDMLVIADAESPVGIAGVMGGFNSEITDDTSVIVFESANFSGPSIRHTAISLGMRTDASSRFEKGLDILGTIPAVDRACELVELLGAGEVMDGTIDVIGKAPETTRIALEPERINALLGTDIPREFMVSTLTELGFTVEGDTITVPSWREDCKRMADIAEEVARFWGYDRIEYSDIRGVEVEGGYSPLQIFRKSLGEICRAAGYTEVITYSFVSPSAWDKIRVPADSPLRDAYTILNPLGEDTSVMRTTSLPSMLGVLSTNLNRRNPSARLYEMATVYRKAGELADERQILTLGAYGDGADFYAVKGTVEALLRAARTPDVRFEADRSNGAYHPGRCASVWSGDTRLGSVGQIHPDVCRAFGLEDETFCAELDSVLLWELRGAENVYAPLPRFPAITRDLAVVCDRGVTVGELSACIRGAEAAELKDVRFFDVYVGPGIPEGKKSVAFSLTLRSDEGTLTDEHAQNAMDRILTALKEKLGAVIR